MAERAAECPLRDKLESEGGNRSGRMSHERSNGSRGGPYRIGSVSKEAEELPAGNSAVESARDGRHAPPLNSSPGAESPPVGVPIDSSSTPVVISPGPATMERQKEVNKRKAHSLIDKVYGRKNLWVRMDSTG